MADKEDYLTSYREFFEHFAKTVNPHDQLPVKLGSYKLLNTEVIGGIIDWTTQYLSQKHCPDHLFSPLIKVVIEEIRKACKKDPLSYGFNSNDNAYEPLKLMQAVMAKTNEVCLRYLDNSLLYSLPPPSSTYYATSVSAKRNKRRTMEDRHVAIHDLNLMFNNQEASPSSYYAIFDGHAGHDAAVYSAAHLHQYLAENKNFINKPVQALLDAFCKTDACFLEKCRVEHFSGGTTAVVALLRPKEKVLYIAWVGDSQALLVKQGKILQCVEPHTPSRDSERARIEREGGSVMFYGTWRVNGQLAVSRAIGDAAYKPYVTAIPEVIDIPLDGGEDFLILACDGLWDHVNEDEAAQTVYDFIAERPADIKHISQHLVQRACSTGSLDNISVIVVFLRDLHQIAAEAQRWSSKNGSRLTSNNMEAGLDNANNPFTNSNGSLKALDVDTDNLNLQKNNDGLLLNLTDNFKANEKSNGTKKSTSELHFDDDFGPETNVDAVDDAFSPLDKEKTFTDDLAKGLQDVKISSIRNLEKSFSEVANNNPTDDGFNPFVNKDPLLDPDSEVLAVSRDETPTPPADPAHDVGGLEVNPTESDSEDEWNYIKGDEEKPEKLLIVESSEEDDTMSQLNPNAAEFVPISPTRSIPSPSVCRPMLDDQVISQSPKRPSPFVGMVPSELEFESEVRSRPSDVYENGTEMENGKGNDSGTNALGSLLAGISLDDITEFKPLSTPPKVPNDEFHFGPSAAPFTPRVLDKSESISTKANFGDDTQDAFNLSFTESDLVVSNRETDAMSASFYAEQGDPNPFLDENDLNKVHELPENVDDFIHDVLMNNKENLPPIGNCTNSTISIESSLENRPNADSIIQTTDLDTFSENNGIGTYNTDREPQIISTPLNRTMDYDGLEEPFFNHTENTNSLELRLTETETKNLQAPESPQESASQESLSPVGLTQDDKQDENLTSSVKDDVFVGQLSPIKSHSPLLDISDKEDAATDSFAANSTEKEVFQPKVEVEVLIEPVCQANPEPDTDLIETSPLESADQMVAESQISESVVANTLTNSVLEPEDSSLRFSEPEGLSPSPCRLEPAFDSSESEVSVVQPEVSVVQPEVSSVHIPEPEEPTLHIPKPEEPSLQITDPEQSSVQIPEAQELILDVAEPEESNLRVPESDVSAVQTPETYEPVLQISEAEVPTVQIPKLEEPVLQIADAEASEVQIPEVEEPVVQTPEATFSPVPTPDALLSPAPTPEAIVSPVQTPEPENATLQLSEAEAEAPTAQVLDQDFSNLRLAEPEVSVHISEPEVPTLQLSEPPVPSISIAEPQLPTPEIQTPAPEVSSEIVVEQSAEAPVLSPLPVVPVAALEVPAAKSRERPTSAKKATGKVDSKSAASPGARRVLGKTSTASPKAGPSAKVPAKTGTTSRPAGITKTASSPSAPKPKTVANTKPASTTARSTGRSTGEAPVSKTLTRPATAAPRTNPISKTNAVNGSSQPTAAPRTITRKSPAQSAAPSKTIPAARPKPLVSSARTATTTVKTATTARTTTASKTTVAPKTTLAPKPSAAPAKPATLTSVSSKPRVPLTRTVPKRAELEKEKKDSANKLTASSSTTITRHPASHVTVKNTSTLVNKLEVKTFRSTTVTKKVVDNKTTSKTTKTTRIEQPKQNGVAKENNVISDNCPILNQAL
ncbi:uncharacterized protein LOC109539536 isoform X2 [Dendroctonus ponderosae]|uniref:uncharacterized protein LOC109539536 isoform X2 n=1 Tax=Dendroctonus ponderosae TaxID=77166 RepID=UPI0020359663|nr:uncharacterized protein LOC109539536 isoform X2 [Dendroctonus ponderosae]